MSAIHIPRALDEALDYSEQARHIADKLFHENSLLKAGVDNQALSILVYRLATRLLDHVYMKAKDELIEAHPVLSKHQHNLLSAFSCEAENDYSY